MSPLKFSLYSLFFLISRLGFGQYDAIQNETIDSMLVWLNDNVKDDSLAMYDLGLIGLSKSINNGHNKQAAEHHEFLSFWNFFHKKLSGDTTVYHDLKAIEYYTLIGDSSKIAYNLSILATDYINIGALEKSQKAIFDAIAIFQQLDNQDAIIQSYGSLGTLYRVMKEYSKSIEYEQRALDSHIEKENYSYAGNNIISLAKSHKELGNYKEAHRLLNQGLGFISDYIPEDEGVHIRLRDVKREVYTAQGYLDSALVEANWVWDFAVSKVGEARAQSYRTGLGEVYYAQGKYKAAIPHMTATIEDIIENDVDYASPMIDKIVKSYKAIGDHENALRYQEILTEMSLEIKEERIANLETEAVIKYETGKKDQEILAQSLQLKQNRKIQWLGFGLLFLLTALLGSLFYNYKKNQKITSALSVKNTENEYLVKEIHHRVKNNLQILSSLLSLQSNYITNSEAADAIKEGRNRVESMGMIHQRLYTGEDKTAINLSEYIDDVCAFLDDSFLLKDRKINILATCDVGMADVETVIPLGLIINELITNSIKYAFDKSQEGEIRVDLRENEQDQLCLVVSDNGRGASEEGDFKDRSTNFGSDLVQVLIKKLKGSLTQDSHNGYTTTIVFDRYNLVVA